ncbi:hypothetical protein SteCoe_2982 [Stentor coeruleus]|uniref:MalT-like TPR region domain-containing protein n=1 Tax=Stentor coeruleus TaxID=5963 RepID=A0A1R2CY80_9CILI|nr:hypothetical protein SteCoe_2982 [Stentor coeruleus]
MAIELVEIIGLFKLGYTKQAIGFLTKLIKKSSNNEGLIEIISKLYTSCQEFISQKEYKVSLQLLQILEDLCTKNDDFSRLCDIKNSMSFCYRICNLTQESLSKCLEALEIVTQHSDLYLKLPALHLNACAIYREDLNDLPKAQIHAKLAYFFAKESYITDDTQKRTLAIAIYNFGFICDELSDFKSAEKWYLDAYDFCYNHWRDKNLIGLIQSKIKNLKTKMNLLNRKIIFSNIPQLTTRRGTSESTRTAYNPRRTLQSQCSKRERKFMQESFTPLAMNSISSHDKSTENSVNVNDPVFNFHGVREKSFGEGVGKIFKTRRGPEKFRFQIKPKHLDF